MKKILLPKDEEQKDYVLYLYKNKNNYHKMNDRDINNLLKLINNGSLDKNDFPIIQKNKTKLKKYEGYSFNKDFFSQI